MSEPDLESLLACSICLGQYKDPKILPCHHSFCKKCLELIPLTMKQENRVLTCPICRKPAKLPEGGVSGLPTSFLLVSLLEVQRRDSTPPSPDEVFNMCEEHNKACDIFCEDCNVVICHHCLIRKHQKHSNSLVIDYCAKNVHCIEKMCSQIRTGKSDLRKASQTLERSITDIKNQEKSIAEAINAKADDQILQINQCRRKLLQRTQAIAERKLSMIRIQTDEVTALNKQLQTCEESIKHFVNEGSKQLSIVQSKSQLITSIKLALGNIERRSLEPAEVPDIVYHQQKTSKVELLGVVNASFINECFRGEKNITVSTCNKKTSFIIMHEPAKTSFIPATKMFSFGLYPCNGQPCEEKEGAIEYLEDLHLFQLTFTPKDIGPQRLIISIGGNPIMGGPFIVHVFGKLVPCKVINPVVSPHGIAVNKDGTIVVSENGGNKVLVFHPNGRKNSFTCPKPAGIAVTADGYVIVADQSNKQVKKFTLDGQLSVELERSGSFKAVVPLPRPNLPHGIAVSQDGRIFITETGSGTFHELNSDLTAISIKTGYTTPTGIALDSHGNTFITSRSSNNFIKYNTATGETKTFSSKGSKEGQLKHPSDIAIDKNNNVYIADTDNNRISVFTSDGQFLKCIGQKGSGGELLEPSGVAVDEAGRVYVSDTGNNRVIVYQ